MNVILLVQTPEDAAALKDCAAGLARLTPEALWLVHSPAVLVDLGAANAEIDKNIAAVQAQIEICKNREDFTGCENYKQQRNALILQKAAAATEGYKTMTPEQQQAATTRVFGEFWAAKPAPKMHLTMHTQHHETKDWIGMMNSMVGNWPAEMVHGQFIVAWPGQFARRKLDIQNVPVSPERSAELGNQAMQNVITEVAASTIPAKRGPGRPPAAYQAHPRYKQLLNTGIDELGAIALRYKLTPEGSPKKIANMIAKHEETNGLLDTPKM